MSVSATVSKILHRPEAETDLIEIWVYIAEENPAAAEAACNGGLA